MVDIKINEVQQMLMVEHHIGEAKRLLDVIKSLSDDPDAQYLKGDIQIHKNDMMHHIHLSNELINNNWADYVQLIEVFDLQNIVPSWLVIYWSKGCLTITTKDKIT